MRTIARPCPVALAALILASLTAAEASAQYPGPPPALVAAPVSPPAGTGLRALGREFFNDLRYPFYAVPQALRPPATRVALRPSYDGRLVPTPVPPTPAKPLFISGYARGVPPEARRPLFPAAARRHAAPCGGGAHHHHGGR